MTPLHALGLAVVALDASPSAHSPLTSSFFFPALVVLAVVVTLVAGVVALREIGGSDWMCARQRTAWRRVVMGVPVAGVLLWFSTRGRTPARRAADEGSGA